MTELTTQEKLQEEIAALTAERDELLIQKRVLLDAIDSWKALNTQGRKERDEAREAARLFYPFVKHFDNPWLKDYPWLEETE